MSGSAARDRGGHMRKLKLALGAVAVAWVTAPMADMSLRGTTDQRTMARWRSGAPGTVAPVVAIPAPRSGHGANRIPA